MISYTYYIIFLLLLVILPVSVAFATHIEITATDADDIDIISDVKNSLNSLSIPFIQNMGQVNSDVKYYVDTFAGHVFVTDDTITYVVTSNDTSYMIQEHAKTSFSITGLDKSSINVSSFIGDDPDKWQSTIPTYDGLNLGQLWDGIDVSLHAYGNNVEKIFTIMPNQDVTQIQMSFDGITEIKKDIDGSLLLSDDGKDIMSLGAPIAFQNIDGEKIFVDVEYEIVDSISYGFLVSTYNKDYILVIDPIIQATYLGGSGNDYSYSIFIDSSGSVFVVGDTASSDYDSTHISGGHDDSYNTPDDIVISKLSADLTSVIQSTYLGGSGDDIYAGGKLDGSDNVFVFARTTSTDFAGVDVASGGTGDGADTSHNGGTNDMIISKLNNDLTTLVQSTYFGGSGQDYPVEIEFDNSDNVFVAGRTTSTETTIPGLTNGADATHNGGTHDIVIAKFTNNLQTLTQSTFFGGSGNDFAGGIAIDDSDNVFVVGSTTSTESSVNPIPALTDGAQTTHQGGSDDIVIVKLTNNLQTFTQSTFFGGTGDDDFNSQHGGGIGLDSSGNVFVAATTTSTSVNGITDGADETHDGGDDIVIVKLANNLQTFTQSTYFGGSGDESLNIADKIAFDSSDNVYVTGFTASTDIGGTSGAIQESSGGDDDIFIAKHNNDLTTLVQSTYFGGTNGEEQSSLVISGDNLYLFFTTLSTNISGTTSGPQESNAGGRDLAIVLLSNNLLLVNPTTTTSDSGGCSDCIDPTFYYSQNRIIVKDGFRYNDYSTDLNATHTKTSPLIINTNQTNFLTLKVYDNSGTNAIEWIDVAFGSPGFYHSFDASDVTIETKFSNGIIVDSFIDPPTQTLIHFGNVTSSVVDCGYVNANCQEITIPHKFTGDRTYDAIVILAVDNSGNKEYHYISDE